MANVEIFHRQPPRKKCRTCVFRASNTERGCNFWEIMRRSRGCPVEDCTEYIKGPMVRKGGKIPWSGKGKKDE